jgi:hypothetical protein
MNIRRDRHSVPLTIRKKKHEDDVPAGFGDDDLGKLPETE